MMKIVTLKATEAPPMNEASRFSLALSMSTAATMKDTAKTIRIMAVDNGRLMPEKRYMKPKVVRSINNDTITEMARAFPMILPVSDPSRLFMMPPSSLYEFINYGNEADAEPD